jgi:4,5-dihydroxyphthalate decarboxylase
MRDCQTGKRRTFAVSPSVADDKKFSNESAFIAEFYFVRRRSMAQLKLTMALSHYDRHIPFFDGTVSPDGIDLTVLEVGESIPRKHGGDRHSRMLQKGEFDICELSLSSYLMAKSRGMPFTGIPVFPRRLFSHSQMWVNVDAGIQSPKDLIGRKVGLNTFQTTLSVLAKGDLQREYGVPWRNIHWFVAREETVAFTRQEGVRIDTIPKGKSMSKMLEEKEIDAFMMPHPPQHALAGSDKICRLFADPRAEELKYFRKNGFYPIMHIVALKDELLAENPWVALSVMNAFAKAKEACRKYYDDPNWSSLVWARHLFEEERRLLGDDAWPYGVEPNRVNLERFMEYSLDQGLMKKPMTVEELCHTSTHRQ